MSAATTTEAKDCEYRRVFIIPPRREGRATAPALATVEVVESLQEAIEGLGEWGDGWRMASLRVCDDGRGHLWFDVQLKRPLSLADQRSAQPKTLPGPWMRLRRAA